MFADDDLSFLKPPRPRPRPRPGLGRDILKIVAVAGLSVIAKDLAKWLVEEIREAAGRPAKKEKTKKPSDESPTEDE